MLTGLALRQRVPLFAVRPFETIFNLYTSTKEPKDQVRRLSPEEYKEWGFESE